MLPYPNSPPGLAGASSTISLQDQLTPHPTHTCCLRLYAQHGLPGTGDTNPCRQAYGATAKPPSLSSLHPLLVSTFMRSSIKPIATRQFGVLNKASSQGDRIVCRSVPRSKLIPLAWFALPLPRAGGRGAADGSAPGERHWAPFHKPSWAPPFPKLPPCHTLASDIIRCFLFSPANIILILIQAGAEACRSVGFNQNRNSLHTVTLSPFVSLE